MNLALIIHSEGRLQGFPESSVGEESTCTAGHPSSIPGLGRSSGEGIGYSLQYSWASLVAQLLKNLPVMREICVQSLGWKDLLEKGKVTHSSILAWRSQWSVCSMGSQRVGHDWATLLSLFPVKDLRHRKTNYLWCHLDRQWKMNRNGPIDQGEIDAQTQEKKKP